MCLGVPGMVTKIEPNELGMTMGTVDFAGIQKQVCLAYVPDVKVGEYVIVHVGFALSKVAEDEAQKVFEALRQLGELAELDIPQPDDDAPPDPKGPAS
jgi:hydrogenase expression/formation protein HypC